LLFCYSVCQPAELVGREELGGRAELVSRAELGGRAELDVEGTCGWEFCKPPCEEGPCWLC